MAARGQVRSRSAGLDGRTNGDPRRRSIDGLGAGWSGALLIFENSFQCASVDFCIPFIFNFLRTLCAQRHRDFSCNCLQISRLHTLAGKIGGGMSPSLVHKRNLPFLFGLIFF